MESNLNHEVKKKLNRDEILNVLIPYIAYEWK